MEVKQSLENDGIDEAMSSALEKLRNLAVSISESAVAEEHVWYRNLLLGIINSALTDYKYVEIGAEQNSAYLAAWGCRNLLELNVITAYVLASAKNATDFKSDFVIDIKEFYEAISLRHRTTHAKLLADWVNAIEEFEGPMKTAMEVGLQREIERGPQTEDTDAEAEAYRLLMAEFGIKEKSKPKRSGDIAALISKREEFQPMFKVCSKIMHRTAFSIASTGIRGSLDEIIPLLSSTAAVELLSIHELIDTYFKLRGTQSPAN